jgi:serine/threonine protein kinase
MAPESLLNQQYSDKSDVYAFGILLCEMYTREEPFPGWKKIEIAMKVSSGELVHPIPQNAPRLIQGIIASTFKYDPNDRPSMLDIIKTLNHI